MKAKPSAYYQREYRKRLREQGLVKKEIWIRPENVKQLTKVEKQLREGLDAVSGIGEGIMTNDVKNWTTNTLLLELQNSELFNNGQASVELIDGVEPSLHIIMHEYGDLPIYLTVSGDQIIVESVLWPTSDVTDIAKFNETVLRTHKYFPLSTICLDTMDDGTEYYQMFGALSSSSILPNIIFEIEVLAGNVIQATEAYGEFIEIFTDAEVQA